MQKWGSWIAVIMLIVLLISGCSAGGHSADKVATNAGMDGEAESKSDMAANTMEDKASVSQESLASAPQEKPAALTDQQLEQGTSSAGAGTAPGFNAQDLTAGLNKKLIYKANLVMQIKDYAQAQIEVRNLVTLAGGYIVNFSETQSVKEQGGTFVMKVPASGFSSFLNKIEKIKHENLQRSIEGQDVSEEYVDLESRLKAKQVMEEQYIAFMKKATKTSDLVSFANELERLQEEIEQVKGRMRYIDQNVSFSTVELRIYQADQDLPKVVGNKEQAPLGERTQAALNGSIEVLTQVFQWIIVILSGALPLLILAAIVFIIFWIVRRSRQRRREEAAEKRKLIREELSAKNEVDDSPIDEDKSKE